jgi:hypothetical protein
MSKKIVFAAFGALAAMALAGGAQANSLGVELKGEVLPVSEVTSDAASATVNLTTPGDQRIATLTYTCNSPTGLTRQISSLNNGALKSGNQLIPYEASHTSAQNSGGTDLNFADTQLAGTLVSHTGPSSDLIRGLKGYFNVNIPSLPANLYAGTYTDTVTIAVSAQ